MASVTRPDVPGEWIERLSAMLAAFPEVREHDAWIGMAWKVRSATIAHVFGGEDQLFRITFRAEADEVMAFQHMGPPYFKASWGSNVVGLLLDEDTDWDEVGELLTESYCIQAPPALAEQVARPATT
ncbi:MmcQ/YjbR family DNA-binding protein [Knoellia subterranea]|uniref:MmcQ/YjbR family DNA-binding protein n=1 Tax=Knoellia subterranea TaxID=184882 RepID=UPI00055D4E2D|nr:MmcQ/YjbR family DNA-binding protein [Knoellia subterranea]